MCGLGDDCYVDFGEYYRGPETRTISGQICQPWSNYQSHNYIKPSDFPELFGGHNYCRNPNGIESQPWCYVQDEDSVKREICVVPVCSKFNFH